MALRAATLPFNSFTLGLGGRPLSQIPPTSASAAAASTAAHLPVLVSSSPRPPLRPARRRLKSPPQNERTTEDDDHQPRQVLLDETYHRNSSLSDLLEEISMQGASSLDLLERDGDWTQEQFWAVFISLKEHDRVEEALQVFDLWKNKGHFRVNSFNYSRVIRVLCEDCLMDQAVSTLHDMEKNSIAPSLAIYNDLVHGFAWKKEFNDARAIITKMVASGVSPGPETYNGLIQAYGSHRMYDDMSKCVKWMESDGCHPNVFTYNILIAEFARGRLIERMEGAYRVLMYKRMDLLSSSMVAMLEAYADLGILDKMDKVYRKVLNSKAFMNEALIRKLAIVCVQNYRFSKLEELGNGIASRTGRTDLVWCILLVSCACVVSRKGIESVTREMEVAKIRFNITFINILALFYLKVKDFRALDAVFSRVRSENVKPDFVTIGILFDACRIGYDGTHVLAVWRRFGFLENLVEIKTDCLVVTAFGKGFFVESCETLFSSLDPRLKEKKLWTYSDLIRLVFGKRENTGTVAAS